MTSNARSKTGAVVIGRNEGQRLVTCLASLSGTVDRIVYVDSGSTDNSVSAARQAGAEVVEIDLSLPFTAARARNAGFEALMAGSPIPEYVQFVDGDCEVQPDWISIAAAFLDENPKTGAVCGRRRERFPDASVYNRLCDWEWDTPVGETLACGGDALMRTEAFRAIGGFDGAVIAGEEPELCVRLRGADWQIWRLDAEMTLHDAAITKFAQWWRRTRRAGHAFAEGAAMHGAPPERHWVSETRKAIMWGAVLPVCALLLGIVHPMGFALLLAWPAQVVRLASREGIHSRVGWERAVAMTLGKLPEAIGALEFWLGRIKGTRRGLIEYK